MPLLLLPQWNPTQFTSFRQALRIDKTSGNLCKIIVHNSSWKAHRSLSSSMFCYAYEVTCVEPYWDRAADSGGRALNRLPENQVSNGSWDFCYWGFVFAHTMRANLYYIMSSQNHRLFQTGFHIKLIYLFINISALFSRSIIVVVVVSVFIIIFRHPLKSFQDVDEPYLDLTSYKSQYAAPTLTIQA